MGAYRPKFKSDAEAPSWKAENAALRAQVVALLTVLQALFEGYTLLLTAMT